MNIINNLKGKLNKDNLKPNTGKKKILLVVIVILLGALGLETTNTDYDIGKIMSGSSVSDSKVMRDINGNVVTDGSGKATDEYNCADFKTQEDAQRFFDNAEVETL
jgi:hypothetical protein